MKEKYIYKCFVFSWILTIKPNFISKRAENSRDPKRISACYYSFNLRIIYSRICSFVNSVFFLPISCIFNLFLF